jgi:sulfur-carrier protein
MAVVFFIPGPLRTFANGRSEVQVPGSFATLRDAFDALFVIHPGLRDRILTEQGEIREHINVFVGKDCVRYERGLATGVPEGSEISVIPAITGGVLEDFGCADE